MANIALSMLVLTCLTGSVLCAADDTLVVTNVLFRHGDRASVSPLPIDRYNESVWPYGYGELTDDGKSQHYTLGKFFKGRYDQLLEDKFDYKKIEVRSSDKDRCLISAYSNLAGLYSNSTKDEDMSLPFIRWQPIPVHTVPVLKDEILAMDRPCKLMDSEMARVFNSSIVRQLNVDYADFFKMLQKKTGVNLTANGFKEVWVIKDTLFCESVHFKPPLPEWTSAKNVSCNDNTIIPCKDKTVWDVLTEMSDYQFYVMYSSPTLHKLEGGPLLEDIVSKFGEYQAGNRSITFNMYSAHDTTVAAVLSALGVFDKKQPNYASSVMIELHKSNNETLDYEVKVFYKPITDNDTVLPMALPGCPAPCRLEDFSKLVDKYKISDWNTECGNNVPPTASTTAKPTTSRPGITKEEIIIIAVCCSLVVIMALILIIYCVRKRRVANLYMPMS